MESVMKYARVALVAPPLIEQEAVRIFVIALQNRWEREARVAARYTLRRPLLEREYVAELEHITAGDLHRLEKYHLECLKKVETIVRCGLTSEWALPVPGCSKCTWLIDKRIISLSGWWVEYKERTIAALAKRTCGESVCTRPFLGEALKYASKCESCGQKDLLNDLSEFSDRLAVEIERVISTVKLDLQFEADECKSQVT